MFDIMLDMINEANVKRFCYEDISLIQNYQQAVEDQTQTWHCHHRVESIMHCGKNELIAKGCYYDRPAHELVFLKPKQHIELHRRNQICRRKITFCQKKPKYKKSRASNMVYDIFFVQFQDTGERFFAKSTGELAKILDCSLSNASKIIKNLDTQKFSLARRAIVKLVDVEVKTIDIEAGNIIECQHH